MVLVDAPSNFKFDHDRKLPSDSNPHDPTKLYAFYYKASPIMRNEEFSNDAKIDIAKIKMIIEKVNQLNAENEMPQVVVGFCVNTLLSDNDASLSYYKPVIHDYSDSNAETEITLSDRGQHFINEVNADASPDLEEVSDQEYQEYQPSVDTKSLFFQCVDNSTWKLYSYSGSMKDLRKQTSDFLGSFTAPNGQNYIFEEDSENYHWVYMHDNDGNAEAKVNYLTSKLAVGVCGNFGNWKMIYIPITAVTVGTNNELKLSHIDLSSDSYSTSGNVSNIKYNDIGKGVGNCLGSWGSCEIVNGSGIQSYMIQQEAFFFGELCHHVREDTSGCEVVNDEDEDKDKDEGGFMIYLYIGLGILFLLLMLCLLVSARSRGKRLR